MIQENAEGTNVARVGVMDGLGVVDVTKLGCVDDEKVVEAGSELWLGTEDATGWEVRADTDVATALVPDWPASPFMELAANSEATRAEMDAKGTVSETSEYMAGVSKM